MPIPASRDAGGPSFSASAARAPGVDTRIARRRLGHVALTV
jgi:hypothetical protein